MPLLLPASFRGAPFAVIASSTEAGRRIALHQYPGRDDPWAEDMGREARRWRFRGFIVDGDVAFEGGPITLQRTLLLAAIEQSGPGLLIHPTLGALEAVVTRAAIGEDLGAGKKSDVDIEFLEAGRQIFPSILSASTGIFTASNLLTAGLAIDGVRLIAAAWANGGRREDLATTAHLWGDQVKSLGSDATALYRIAAQLPGNYGRFASGGNSGLNGQRSTTYSADTQLSDLIPDVAQQRAYIVSSAAGLQPIIANSNLNYATDVSDAAVALVRSLANACADPADAIRLLEDLIEFSTDWPAASTPIGSPFVTMVRRAAVAALAIAASQYQPASADDAATKIAEIGGIIDDQATAAADAGDDASYQALRSVRSAVVQDLRARGSSLPQIKTFRPGAALPALALAQRYYRDSGRADQLLVQAQPVHPLFMPPTFTALAA